MQVIFKILYTFLPLKKNLMEFLSWLSGASWVLTIQDLKQGPKLSSRLLGVNRV